MNLQEIDQALAFFEREIADATPTLANARAQLENTARVPEFLLDYEKRLAEQTKRICRRDELARQRAELAAQPA